MKRILLNALLIVVLGIAGLVLWAAFRVRASSVHADGSSRSKWSPAAAAAYLDDREAWWQGWKPAQLEKGTVCISCHTVVPYAFVRPALRRQLGETGRTPYESKMLGSIETRVNEWPRMKPYYTDAAHALPSHSTEAVLNAVVLAAYSTKSQEPGPVVRHAFDNAWALQKTTGRDVGGCGFEVGSAPPQDGEPRVSRFVVPVADCTDGDAIHSVPRRRESSPG